MMAKGKHSPHWKMQAMESSLANPSSSNYKTAWENGEIVQRSVKEVRTLTANSTMRASTMLPTTVTKSKVFHESLKQLCKKEEVEKLLHITSSTGLKLLQLLSCHHAKSTEHTELCVESREATVVAMQWSEIYTKSCRKNMPFHGPQNPT